MTLQDEAGMVMSPVKNEPVPTDLHYAGLLNQSLRRFYWDAVKAALRDPAQALFFMRTMSWQRRAQRVRQAYAEQGCHVPPILIYSITNRCNLHCKGCYHRALRGTTGPELSGDEVKQVVNEAAALGISFFVIAGGEPFVRPETLE